MSGLIGLLVILLVVGLIVMLIFWLIDYIPIPAPFGRAAKAVTAVIAVLIVIAYALPLAGVRLPP